MNDVIISEDVKCIHFEAFSSISHLPDLRVMHLSYVVSCDCDCVLNCR